ncbi:MAG: aldo/keto reductase [Thermoguttaceae bacterium]|nr:aldo/keto reductase [Thermoguttaceae bacterium]
MSPPIVRNGARSADRLNPASDCVRIGRRVISGDGTASFRGKHYQESQKMIYRTIGKSNISASVVAFGTFPLGGWMWGGCDEKAALNTIAEALDLGINLFDTAPLYGWGSSEELLGRAMKGKREKFVVSTKCGLRWNGPDFTEDSGEFHFRYDERGLNPNGPMVCRRYLSAKSIRWEVEQSLRRLETDYIDIYFTHAPDATTPLEESIDELLRLKAEGKILTIGCSNVSNDQMKQYIASGELDLLQERFSLLDRHIESNGLIDLARDAEVSFFAYTPLENGLLTGSVSPNRVYPEGDLRKNSPRFSAENIEKVNAMLSRFRPIAEAHGLSLGQLATAWNFSRYDKGHVLCGMRTAEAVRENAAAGRVQLSEEETARMVEIASEYQFAVD